MKAYFITNVEVEASRLIGKRHVQVANDSGDFQASLYPATKANEAQKFLDENGLKFLDKRYWTEGVAKRSNPADGVKGCFCSHYRLWKLCVEMNETIGIMEYDALQVHFLPGYARDFEDYLYLSAWRNMKGDPNEYGENDTEPGIHLYLGYHSWGLNNVTSGSHAYLIRPRAAKALIDTVHTKGWLSTDRIVSSDLVPFNKETITPAVFKVEGSLNLSQLRV